MHQLVRHLGAPCESIAYPYGDVDDRDGRRYVYDINALSNFVADAPNVIGFDPFERLVDYLEKRLARQQGGG